MDPFGASVPRFKSALPALAKAQRKTGADHGLATLTRKTFLPQIEPVYGKTLTGRKSKINDAPSAIQSQAQMRPQTRSPERLRVRRGRQPDRDPKGSLLCLNKVQMVNQNTHESQMVKSTQKWALMAPQQPCPGCAAQPNCAQGHRPRTQFLKRMGPRPKTATQFTRCRLSANEHRPGSKLQKPQLPAPATNHTAGEQLDITLKTFARRTLIFDPKSKRAQKSNSTIPAKMDAD